MVVLFDHVAIGVIFVYIQLLLSVHMIPATVTKSSTDKTGISID